jgi:hypothetical protein
MYSKQEAAKLKEEFWTAFGQYMAPILSADGEKTNWINYKTGEKHIQFRMQADNKKASIAIELSHTDQGIQQLYFEQFMQLKNIFQSIVREEWLWAQHITNEHGKTISRIYNEIKGVSIFKREDWPGLISFFKPRIISLDEFWSNVKYSFEALK